MCVTSSYVTIVLMFEMVDFMLYSHNKKKKKIKTKSFQMSGKSEKGWALKQSYTA